METFIFMVPVGFMKTERILISPKNSLTICFSSFSLILRRLIFFDI